MSLMLMGLLCLCFVSFGRTKKLSGGRRGIHEVCQEHDVQQALFSLMDSHILSDNKITLSEFKQVWRKHDINKDGLLSGEDLRVVLKKLKVRPSNLPEMIFADLYLDDSNLQLWFHLFDVNSDGIIIISEFVSEYNDWHTWYDIHPPKGNITEIPHTRYMPEKNSKV